MCRLFGFRSVLQSQVHRSLRSADNALAVQSREHPDGWGVAYYVAGSPHILKSTGTAGSDHLFERVSGLLTSDTVVAHVRRATQGALSTLNCHPFQHGRWVMAHNGDIPAFPEVRDALVEQVAPKFRRFLMGDTDSEVVFHLFLGRLAERVDLHRRGTPLDDVVCALRETVAIVRELADSPERRSLLTLMVTDGELLVAHHGGKDLCYSTWKQRCPERETCTFLGPTCEAPVTHRQHVNHLLVSSEPLLGENAWERLAEGEVVAVDPFMRFHRFPAVPA
ncbi:MAG: class II glutamine amidotransferase [Alphaproteobacteria bacterium]|nr:class II glutamine amidotransferase [Alphaproteobacteria bacterium]MCB9698921.1 class II glutamine amidotransferase [Alphaproteobacteria bacterium]